MWSGIGPAALELKSSSASELFVTVVIATSLASEPVLQAPGSREGRAVGEDRRFGRRGGGGICDQHFTFLLFV